MTMAVVNSDDRKRTAIVTTSICFSFVLPSGADLRNLKPICKQLRLIAGE
jgi:hypothetical protein